MRVQASIPVVLLWALCFWAAGGEEESERLFNQGLIPFQEQRLEEALTLFEKAAAEDPPYYQATYHLGVTRLKLKQYREAVPPLVRTLQLMPDFVPALQDLALAHYHQQQYSQALDLLAKADALRPHDGYTHYYTGLCRLSLFEESGDSPHLSAALAHFRRAAVLSQDVAAISHYYAGVIHAREARWVQAEQAFAEASSASGNPLASQEARKQLARIRGGPRPDKRWRIRLSAAFQHDSNVVLEPDRGPSLAQITGKEDAGFVLAGGAEYDFWRFEKGSAAIHYDFHQSLYTDITDFNLQAHQVRLSASRRLSPFLMVGVQGAFSHFLLGGDSYLQETSVTPYVSYAKKWSRTLAYYRVIDEDFRISLFDPDRDGTRQEVEVRQSFRPWEEEQREFFIAYRLARDDPGSASGNDFDYISNEAEAGFGFPFRKLTLVEIAYAFRNYDYRFPNTRSPAGDERSDNAHYIRILFKKPLRDRIQLNFGYRGTINNSNVAEFAYDRHMVSGGIQIAF